MLRTTVLKKSIIYHDKIADRHMRKVEGPCNYCGTVFVSTAFGTEKEVEDVHVCSDCYIERQKLWKV